MTIIYSSKPLAKRREYDFYETPREFVDAVVEKYHLHEPKEPSFVLDPGAGTGVWGEAVREHYKPILLLQPSITGVELREVEPHHAYDYWITKDFLEFNSPPTYNLILGNPPYSLAEDFLEKSYTMIPWGGHILFLLRLAFLEGLDRYSKYYNKFMYLRPKEVWVSTRRISFTGDRKSDSTAYAMFLWQKGWAGDTKLDWINWNYREENEDAGAV